MTTLNENTGIDLIFKSRKGIIEMLEYRGYDVSDYASFTKQEIILLYEKNTSKYLTSAEIGPLDIIVKNKEGDKIFVKYKLDEKFKKSKVLNQIVLNIYDKHLKETDEVIILVIKRDIFKPHKKDSSVELVEDMFFENHNLFIQIFGLENFLFNIMKHKMMPKHQKMSNKEIKELLDKYKINKEQLPTIRRDDPPIKYMGLKIGDICKIDRYTGEIIYRLVSE